jgi:hypothetical protein
MNRSQFYFAENKQPNLDKQKGKVRVMRVASAKLRSVGQHSLFLTLETSWEVFYFCANNIEPLNQEGNTTKLSWKPNVPLILLQVFTKLFFPKVILLNIERKCS